MLSTTVRTPARLVLPLAVLLVAPPLSAQEPERAAAQPQQQREHVVRRGDTLWDLARLYLGNPFLWPSIYDANRTIVEDPHWIYPLERLLIPPVMARDAVQHAVPAPTPVGEPVQPPAAAAVVQAEPAPVAAQVATVDMRRAIVPLPEYLAAPWVSPTTESQVIGRVVAPRDPEARDDRLPPMLHPRQLVHVGALTGAVPAVGDSMVIVRFGREVPGRGRVVEPLAVLAVENVDGRIATARVARHFGEARIGDAVIRLAASPAIGLGTPEPVTDGARGELLQFLRDEPLYGTTDLAFLSLGAADVGIGDEVTVYVPGQLAPAGGDQLPAAAIATMRVVRVVEGTATARVLTINSTALRDGLPVRVTRRMQ